MTPDELRQRERGALELHRASLRGGALPDARSAAHGTFMHGLLLPLSLLVATLREPTLRGPFLRLAAVRMALLLVVGAMYVTGKDEDDEKRGSSGPVSVHVHPERADASAPPVSFDAPGLRVHIDKGDASAQAVNVDAPGLHVHIDPNTGQKQVEIMGQEVPVNDEGKLVEVRDPDDVDDDPPGPDDVKPPPPPPPTTLLGRIRASLSRGWARTAAIVGGFSTVERAIVFLSRSWDDWLAFSISGLAGIRPETAEPPKRRLSLSMKALWRRAWRWARGFIVFTSGLVPFYALESLPVVGRAIFGAIATISAWYWGGVFTAAKSAHAWADDGVAGPPMPVARFQAFVARGWWFWPLRLYGRLWARVVRSVNAAASVFDRSPVPFLGLTASRAMLALPGLYLLTRPVIAVAAGRLTAEADPTDRFSSRAWR